MKYLKLLLIFFAILFLNSCGYKKLNSENLNDFKIDKLEISGEKKLAYKLKNNIEVYSYQNSKFIYDIKINLISTKETKIKNIAGKTTRYASKFQADTTVINTNTKNVYSKTFSSTNDYDIGSTHSDTLNNEKKAIENNLNYVSDEIVKFLKLLHIQ
jgi:outer membrane lipopolysaccharide assembly protein LptE/RlpB